MSDTGQRVELCIEVVLRALGSAFSISHRDVIGMSSHFVPAVGAPQNKLLAALPAFDWKRVKRYFSFLDRIGVEACCCECYRVMRRECDSPRPYVYAIDPTSLEPGEAHSRSVRSKLKIA